MSYSVQGHVLTSTFPAILNNNNVEQAQTVPPTIMGNAPQTSLSVQLCCQKSFTVVSLVSLPTPSYVALTCTLRQSTWQAHMADAAVFSSSEG